MPRLPLPLLALLLLLAPAAARADDYLFVTFKDPGQEGIWFGLSNDGYRWELINHGQPWLRTNAAIKSARDPFITRGPDGVYHLIWTSGRAGFGYTTSTDLVHWVEPRRLPVWAGDTTVRNLWAPELVYDETAKHWLIFWSSTVEDKFPATEGQVENSMNHRIYAMTTTDFVTFTEPRVFYDPGYPVIDATLHHEAGRWTMIFKDERREPLHKQLRQTSSATLAGPWSEPTAPLTVPWTEGPSVLKVADGYLLYYDLYKPAQHMGALASTDLQHWSDVTEKLSFPDKTKHGAFLKITAAEATRLRTATSPASPP